MNTLDENPLGRTALLIGDDAFQRLQQTRVILFGIGGVGSWCAESLVRSGIVHLTLVDADTICPSNINRQLPATSLTVGRPKVEVMKERLLAINPSTTIETEQRFYDADTAGTFGLDSYDCIIDAIDTFDSKLHLIYTATQTDALFVSSMGAALKMDPQRIRIAEFWNVCGCPLAAALRRKIRTSGHFPARKFNCVYSDELLTNQGIPTAETQRINSTTIKRINGTVAHITAIFGFMLAGLVIDHLCTTSR